MTETRQLAQPQADLPVSAQRIQAQDFAELKPSRHKRVCNWLAMHQNEHYLVSENLTAIYTDKPHGRNAEALKHLVEQISGGVSRLIFVDAAIFSTVQDMAKLSTDEGREHSTDVARQVERILQDAIAAEASDVHVRIRTQHSHVLFRVHGMLNHYQTYSRQVGLRLARTVFNYFARTNKDFSERMPMDGAFDIEGAGEIYGIRANLMNEVRGCTLVMRLRSQRRKIALSASGYDATQCALIRRGMQQSGGLMLFCGPTNSGKSTTLSNLIAEISIERNVISIEDPVELKFDAVAHVDLSRQHEDVQLHDLLACTVRQDPDMLVLAEIRDQKTAQYAENMALQGRFVASTLHAESISAIPMRLLRLGMDETNFFVPGFLNVLVAQTLLPLNCPHCCMREHPDKHVDAEYKRLFDASDALRYRNSAGCERCRSGVGGRTLVAEVLKVDRQLRTLLKQCDYDGIVDYMRERDIMTRHHHARDKVLAGLIDPQLTESRLGMLDGMLP